LADTFVHRVLVTGSNGAIGQPVCLSLLARGHQVRGFDRVAFADLPDSRVGDLADAAALRRAMEGMDTVIHYGLSKVYGEAMGEMYARGHGLDVIAVRLGFLPRAPMFVERLLQGDGQNIYISPGDCGRFFAAAVEADLPEKFLVFHAIGKAERPCYDIEPARRILGYEPRDRWPEGMAFPKP
jgi:nucleoside-diphosphate-sugar epimerase